MALKIGTIGIIADDLTGANDTALQFYLSGCNTQILLDYSTPPIGKINTQAWAVSTETRNLCGKEAAKIVYNTTKLLVSNLNIEYLYKKIDSTLRGNVAYESLAVLEAMNWDAAVIVPAFPAEGRTTVGGYHLLKGTPIERTEVARDPLSPIFQSFIPALLKQQVDKADIIDSIQLMTVMRGAGPILMELQNLIKRGKKLIVIDAVSTTDIEQIALAIQKSPFKILPCGSAGLAQALTKCHLPEMKHQHINKVIPTLPIFIVVGSATDVTRTQIRKLMESDEMEPSFTELSPEQVLSVPSDELVNRIIEDMGNDGIVLVHSVPLDGNLSNCTEYAREHGIEPENMPGIVSDFLADLTQKVVEKQSVILITIGGETSYKCCNAIGSKHLQLIDEVEPAIPLCLDHNAQWIITKSGNLGNPSTLINILKYFKKHQEVK